MAKTKRRKAQTAQKKSNTVPIIIGVVVIIAVVAGLIIFNQANSKPVVTDIVVDYPTGITEDGYPYKGGANASVQIEEFADFRCPHCKEFDETVKSISDDYIKTEKIKLVFRNYAFLGQGSVNAAQAAQCALEQGSDEFWAYHDAIFANQSLGESVFTRSGLKSLAEQVGLDTAAFDRCLNTNATANAVQEDLIEGSNRGVNSTPTLFINGEIVRGGLDAPALRSSIDQLLEQ